MARSIVEFTRGLPTTDRGWLDVFARINKYLRVSGDELVIDGDIQLPEQSVGTAEIEDGAVTDGKLRESQARSVIGRSLGSAGQPTDIQATTNGHYLRQAGGVLGFGAIADSDLPSTIARDSDVSGAISDHEAAADPHPGYTTGAEVSAAIDTAFDAFASSGDFVGTLTGCSDSPTGTIFYRVANSMVLLDFDEGFFGTSNSTAATITGLPAAIWPARKQVCVARVEDNGVTVFGLVSIDIDGSITLTTDADSGTFTASGSKGINRLTVCYLIE
jgi:hypothetical protein